MTKIAPLVENVDSIIKQQLSIKQELLAKKEELAKTELYQQVLELERLDRELSQQHDQQIEEITNQMLNVGLKQFETMDGRKLLLKKSPGKCVITNEDMIDEKYKIEKTTISIDKKTILQDLRNGEAIPGAGLEYSYKLQFTDKR